MLKPTGRQLKAGIQDPEDQAVQIERAVKRKAQQERAAALRATAEKTVWSGRRTTAPCVVLSPSIQSAVFVFVCLQGGAKSAAAGAARSAGAAKVARAAPAKVGGQLKGPRPAGVAGSDRPTAAVAAAASSTAAVRSHSTCLTTDT